VQPPPWELKDPENVTPLLRIDPPPLPRPITQRLLFFDVRTDRIAPMQVPLFYIISVPDRQPVLLSFVRLWHARKPLPPEFIVRGIDPPEKLYPPSLCLLLGSDGRVVFQTFPPQGCESSYGWDLSFIFSLPAGGFFFPQ